MKRLMLVLLASTLFATSAWAGFINGGFEDGNLNGWTLGGYTADSGIVTAGMDSNALGLLPRTSNGNYAVRVGNQAGGGHTSSISQTVANWQDVKVWFAWAALLQEPTNQVYHSPGEMPDYSVSLYDITTSTSLYNQAFNVTNLPPTGWHTGAINSVAGSQGLWHYSDWYAVNLDTSGVIGHDLRLTITASDCSLGGHGGYVYLDQVGSEQPIIPTVPEPSTVILLGVGVAGLAMWRRNRKS